MSEYKLMPKQITKEMADAFWEEYSKSRTDDLLMRCYKAMYVVAPQPAVQEEPVGWQFYLDGTWWDGGNLTKQQRKNMEEAGVRVRDVYTAPQQAQDVECNQSRESAMLVLEQGPDGTPDVWCDPEIADLVSALNKAGIRTVASCSGHGHRPGNIMLSDGRELAIARDFDEARKIDAIFTGINGEPPMVDVEALVEALTISRDYVFSSLEEKKLALAGYPQMWRCEQDDLAMIDATLATYRKGTSHDKE